MQARDGGGRQSGQQSFVLRQCQKRVVSAGGKHVEQFARRSGRVADGITGGGEIIEKREHARRHVEADRITGAAGCAGIVGHQHGDAALAARQRAQANERGDAVGDHGNRGPLRAGSPAR